MIYIILFIIAAVGVLDTIILLLYTNINVGTLLPGIIGCMLGGFAYVKLFIRKGKPIFQNVIVRRLVCSFIIIGLLSFAAIETMIIYNSYSQDEEVTDYLIILGAGVNGDLVSLALQERLDKGLEYLNKCQNTKVIVSGGQGYGENISEAEAMKRYLVVRGIASERIILEDRATSTLENFKFSKELLLSGQSEINSFKSNDGIKVMVITNDFHMFRAKLLARRVGFEPYGLTCSTPIAVRLNCYLREALALVKSYFLDRV